MGESYIRSLAGQPRRDLDLDVIIRDNIRANDRAVPGPFKQLERVGREGRGREREERRSAGRLRHQLRERVCD